ncbi:MAG: hypothetical protein Q9219_004228 [cf. Caloplaca sp. 3 TL-2023]
MLEHQKSFDTAALPSSRKHDLPDPEPVSLYPNKKCRVGEHQSPPPLRDDSSSPDRGSAKVKAPDAGIEGIPKAHPLELLETSSEEILGHQDEYREMHANRLREGTPSVSSLNSEEARRYFAPTHWDEFKEFDYQSTPSVDGLNAGPVLEVSPKTMYSSAAFLELSQQPVPNEGYQSAWETVKQQITADSKRVQEHFKKLASKPGGAASIVGQPLTSPPRPPVPSFWNASISGNTLPPSGQSGTGTANTPAETTGDRQDGDDDAGSPPDDGGSRQVAGLGSGGQGDDEGYESDDKDGRDSNDRSSISSNASNDPSSSSSSSSSDSDERIASTNGSILPPAGQGREPNLPPQRPAILPSPTRPSRPSSHQATSSPPSRSGPSSRPNSDTPVGFFSPSVSSASTALTPDASDVAPPNPPPPPPPPPPVPPLLSAATSINSLNQSSHEDGNDDDEQLDEDFTNPWANASSIGGNQGLPNPETDDLPLVNGTDGSSNAGNHFPPSSSSPSTLISPPPRGAPPARRSELHPNSLRPSPQPPITLASLEPLIDGFPPSQHPPSNNSTPALPPQRRQSRLSALITESRVPATETDIPHPTPFYIPRPPPPEDFVPGSPILAARGQQQRPFLRGHIHEDSDAGSPPMRARPTGRGIRVVRTPSPGTAGGVGDENDSPRVRTNRRRNPVRSAGAFLAIAGFFLLSFIYGPLFHLLAVECIARSAADWVFTWRVKGGVCEGGGGDVGGTTEKTAWRRGER